MCSVITSQDLNQVVKLMIDKNSYNGLNHVSILVTDIDRSVKFYVDLLGLEVDLSRPEMAFPGLWLKLGNQQIHLLSLGEKSSGTGADHPGRDAHFAVSVKDISKIEELLTGENITFKMSVSGRLAIFCRDPDGNGIEFVEIASG